MADVEFRLLGPLEVVRDRAPVDLPPGLPRTLLGRLLLSINAVVATDRLIEDLWRGGPPASAGQALRVYVSNLRRLLEPDRGPGRPPQLLVTRPPGYLLAAEPRQTDAGRFELLVAEGGSAFEAGRAAEASKLFAEALGLWRGSVLADLGDESFVGPEAARLEELRLVAADHWAEAELALGRHRELVGELEALIRLHPFRERLWAQLIVALYRSDRQADALQAYQRLRTLLADELGLEPSPPLRQLEAAVLRHDPDLAVPAGIAAPATPRPAAIVGGRPEVERGFAQLARMPFVGREKELLRLTRRWAQAVERKGNLVLVAGEPGIGKTRLTEELAEQVRSEGGEVLRGQCFEGEWMPPYAPFAAALEVVARPADAEALRTDLGLGAPTLAQLVPALRQVLPDLPDAAPLPPDEERFRLQDAMVRFLGARSERAPLLVCLDDLHWADTSSVGALRHLARLVGRHRILVLGTYRDAEVGRDHPLAQALGALPREAEYERICLEGLARDAVGDLLATLAEHDVDDNVSAAVARETEGNPFFIREVLRHLVEEGRIRRGADGRWNSELPPDELGIPEGVRQVIRRRLARLSGNANRLLGAACSFEGPFRLQVAAGVADLGEEASLDALDETLEAQLLETAAGGLDCYAFTHALVRHTLYEELSPSRRARLHRKVAVDLEAAVGTAPSPAELGEIAVQYHRSAGLPGGERGVAPALAAAAYAEETGGQREAARFLRLALDLLPSGDARRPRLLGRLGMALIWGLASDDGVAVAGEAGEALAAAEGPDAAADYLAEAAAALGLGGNNPLAWELARQGLRHAGERRDLTWARLVQLDHFRRETQDAEYPGIPIETPERWEAARIIRAANPDPVAFGGWETPLASRAEALTSRSLVIQVAWAGEYAASLPVAEAVAAEALLQDRVIRAARAGCVPAFCHVALGNLAAGQAALEQGERLAARIGTPLFVAFHARELLAAVLDEDEALELVAETFSRLPEGLVPAQAWALGTAYAISARTAARLARQEDALRFLELLVPWLERAPGWATHFPVVACHAAETLWWLERLDHASLIERALREKVIAPDFRDPMVDGRLALARLCALDTDRQEEAASWFAEARRVLSEQGARPLLAIADHDEAVMYARRGGPGDDGRARALVEAAHEQFEAIGMTGWSRRADAFRRRLT